MSIKYNIILLDIDGVLNTFDLDKDFVIVDNLFNNLKEIVTKTNSHIVISSDWKYDLPKLKNIWSTLDIENFIDTTPNLKLSGSIEDIRRKEINHWINNNNNIINKYIIIDDLDLKMNNHIKINPYIGLDNIKKEKIINLLNFK